MSRPLRDKDPERYRLITLRTEEARLWLIPSRNMEKLVGGILARYQEVFNIVIYAYSFLSNHFHLLIKAPNQNTDEFMENLDREIARRVNWKNRRQGKFWARRYTDQKVLTEEDLLEAYLYITTNPIKHGLVDHPSKWTGLCSFHQSINETQRSFTFYHYSQQNPEFRTSRHALKLTVLPQFADLRQSERKLKLNTLIEERTQELVKERTAQGGGFLGIQAVLLQAPGSIPQNVSRSERPPCYSKDAAAIRDFAAQERARTSAYDEASMRYRHGDNLIQFPEFSFKPPLHRTPRLKPFTPLPEDYFKNAA